MLNAFGSPRNLDKRRLQLAKKTGVVQAARDGVVQAAHRRSWCFCVCGVWLALALVRIRREVREREIHTAAPKVRPHPRACAHTRPRHRRGVGERPHVRGSVEPTASLAVAKTRCRGGQTRWPWRAEWPLQGMPSKKAAGGGCSPISTNHVALFGLSCTRCYPAPAPCFGNIPTRYTLFWSPPQTPPRRGDLSTVALVSSSSSKHSICRKYMPGISVVQ